MQNLEYDSFQPNPTYVASTQVFRNPEAALVFTALLVFILS